MVPSPAISKIRLDALTGLRFFAVLLVYGSHHPLPDYLPERLAGFFMAGYNGVTIFFVLSGFVIGLNYLESISTLSPQAILRYLIARLARVYPLYLLVLIYVWLNLGAPQDESLIFHILALQSWLPQLSQVFRLNPPGWSVGVEFFLYACFPIIAILIAPYRKNQRLLWLLVLATFTAMVLLASSFTLTGLAALPRDDPNSAHRWLYRIPLTRLGDFSLGILGALLYRKIEATQQRINPIWTIITYVAIGCILLFMGWTENLFSAFSWDVAYSPFAFLLILGLALVPTSAPAQLLASRPLVILGEASFAMYLIHFHLMQIFDIGRYSKLMPIVAVPLWLAFGGITLWIAVGLNRLIETPIRHWINDRANQWIKGSSPTLSQFDKVI